jgi:hypothetical protein
MMLITKGVFMSYLDDLFGLAGKTAIVSGGAGVIGIVMPPKPAC